MRVLHVFGDWKWTGPAEPTLDLCLELRKLGVDTQLACPQPPPEASTALAPKARERGLVPRHDFALNKNFNIRDNFGDVSRIRAACEAENLDILHVHFSHDHILAGLAARRAKNRPLVFRTNQKAVPSSKNPGSRFLYGRLTDGYLTYSRTALDADVAAFKLNDRAWLIPPALELARFTSPPKDMRAANGLSPSTFVLGVVARMQRHRRFDVLLEGIKKAGVPDLRVFVVGRGTHMNEVAVEPAKKLGLEKIVTFTGYLGADYPAMLAAFDALVFLVPGSDGTCRALRETMAAGRAVIGANRGMIPEIVDDGKTGLVIDDTPEGIASAIRKLASDRAACAEMGRRGKEKAATAFDPKVQAAAVLKAYETALRNRT